MMTEISKLHKKQIEILHIKRNQELRHYIEIFEDAKKWINAKEGENVGYGRFYIDLEKLILRDIFRGFGSGGSKEIDFPSKNTANIFGEMQLIGKMSLSIKLIDAFIDLFESELTQEND